MIRPLLLPALLAAILCALPFAAVAKIGGGDVSWAPSGVGKTLVDS